MKKILFVVFSCFLFSNPCWSGIIDFDPLATGDNHYFSASVTGNYDWVQGGATFNYNKTEYAWNGFTYSDVMDVSSSGNLNQYAVYGDGRDYSDGGVYAVGYMDSYNGVNPMISFGSAQTVNSLYVNNTTYAALDMISGSDYSKAFSTNDWFRLTIEGFDGLGESLGSVTHLLADYAGYSDGDDKHDYMTTDWTQVNLSGLGDQVRLLEFTLSSSDNGGWGMNTPAYFAIDQIDIVPEPSSLCLLLVGFGVLAQARCRLRR